MPGRARPPRRRSRACARTVFPAPVSPVITLRPPESSRRACSISRRFCTDSSRSIAQGLPASGDGTGSARQASELLAQAQIEARSVALRERRNILREARDKRLGGPELTDRAAVDRHQERLVGAVVQQQLIV